MKNWYAVHCKPGQDARAELHLGNQQYEVFRPLARVRKRCRGAMKDTIESLFPRYLFVQLDAVAENWAPIRSTRGVTGLVRFKDQPATVPTAIIDQLRQRMDAERCVDMSQGRFAANQRVRIVDGPFNGWEGIFQARKGEDRVIILLTMMQQAQKLAFPEACVEPV